MNTTTLPTDSVAIEKTAELSASLVDHVENVIWGSAEGTRYTIVERRASLRHVLHLGFFVLLHKAEKLCGTLFCLPKKISLGNGRLVSAIYESVLSVHPDEGGKGYAKTMVEKTLSEVESGGFLYAYVEEKNTPSSKVFEHHHFECVGQFFALTFNRVFPKLSPRAQGVLSADVPLLKARLAELYQGHALADFEMSFDAEHYWVLKDGDEILAGVQIEEERWSIVSLPGVSGTLAVNALVRIPLLKYLLDLKSIPVLKIGNLYVPPGREREFIELVSHLTQHYRKKLALAYLDKRSPIYQRLKKSTWFGIFNPLFETPVNVWARFRDVPEADIQALKKMPLVISPLDIS